MTPKLRFVFWLISVMVACSLGFFLAYKPALPVADATERLALVGQAPITRGEVEKVYPAFLGRITAEVILTRLINGAAQQNKLTIDSKEISWPRHLRTQADFVSFGSRLYADVYLRKLILAEWPEERLRRVYSLFQDELAEYDVSFTEILNAEDISAVQSDLDGEVDYASLAPRYSTDESGKLHQWRRWYSSVELEESFGKSTAATIMDLRNHTWTKPLRIGSKFFIFNLYKARKSFNELRPFLEQRAIDAHRSALLYELLGKVKLEVGGSLGDDPKILEFRL